MTPEELDTKMENKRKSSTTLKSVENFISSTDLQADLFTKWVKKTKKLQMSISFIQNDWTQLLRTKHCSLEDIELGYEFFKADVSTTFRELKKLEKEIKVFAESYLESEALIQNFKKVKNIKRKQKLN